MTGKIRHDIISNNLTCLRDDDTLYPAGITMEKTAYAREHGLKLVDLSIRGKTTLKGELLALINAGNQEAAQQRLVLFLLTGE